MTEPRSLSATATASLRATIDAATAHPSTQIPGISAHVIDKTGRTLFSHASGTRGVANEEPVTEETIFWLASCTKMISGIACMQLVEQGRLDLDDADQAEAVCPEFRSVMVLGDDGVLVPKRNRITVRMLLTHTSGYGYSFFSPKLHRHSQPSGLDEFDGTSTFLSAPLLFEPGTSWAYGSGVDWAGVMVERITSLSLEDYFQQHIFQPLGIREISFFPGREMRARLAWMHHRDHEGQVRVRDHLLRRPLVVAEDPEERKGAFCSGGAGCYAKLSEYCDILATLLNSGRSPKTNHQLLKPATVEAMLTNQIPQMPNFARVPVEAAKPDLTNSMPCLYPQPAEQPQGWGLTFMQTIHPGATGRGPNTVWWAGIANLFWWCDVENGVAGIVGSQMLPFGDPQVMGLWTAIEAGVYSGLQQSKL